MTELQVKISRSDTHAVVTVTSTSEDDEAGRPKLDVEFCQDVSGSMGSGCGAGGVSRIKLCKETLKFTLRHLREHRMGLTTFDSEAKVHIPFQTVGQDISSLDALVHQMMVGSATNLSAGLQKALLELQGGANEDDGSDQARVRYLMVFTDGVANQGIVDQERLSRLIQSHQDEIQGTVKVCIFAFGDQCNHDLLQGLSSSVGGNYYELKTGEDIPTAIGEALGTALETRQQNLEFLVPPDLMETMPGEDPGFSDLLRNESRSRLFRLMDPDAFKDGLFTFPLPRLFSL